MLDISDSWTRLHKLSELILSANSATEMLERWCLESEIADSPVVALCARNAPVEAMDSDSLEALYPQAAGKTTRFRCVRLAASGIVLVDALNWYFPENLTVDICHQLETTDIPFGRAIKNLSPTRRTFLVRRCTPDQLLSAEANEDPDFTAFEHRAVVYGRRGKPLAVVHERFRTVLVFRVPKFVTVTRKRNVPAKCSEHNTETRATA
jgi:chorismate-pyruvate lyase